MYQLYSNETEFNVTLPDVLSSVACDIARKSARNKKDDLVLVDFDERRERTFYSDGTSSDWRAAILSHWALDA